jgi:hypothetical protein
MKNKRTVLLGIGIGAVSAITLLLVFFFGIYVGSKKAGLFPFWERRHIYQNGFVSPKFGHGIVGIIDSIGEESLVVRDRSGALKTVLVDKETLLRRGHSEIKFSDLKKDEQVIVIGEPQEKEGAIKAKVIRVFGQWVK